MEGDPRPGATVGRMSFQSFNPSIDASMKKLNEAASNVCTPDASGGRSSSSENGSASEATDCSKVGADKHEGNGDLKRKQSDMVSEPVNLNKSPKMVILFNHHQAAAKPPPKSSQNVRSSTGMFSGHQSLIGDPIVKKLS